jgi:hypothetical protein
MMLEVQVLAWDRHKNVAGLNWVIGFQPSPLFIIAYPKAVQI